MAKSKKSKSVIRNALLIGMGITTITKKKARQYAKTIQKDYKLNDSDAKKITDELIKSSKTIVNNMQKDISKSVNDLSNKFSKKSKKKSAKKKTTKKKSKTVKRKKKK